MRMSKTEARQKLAMMTPAMIDRLSGAQAIALLAAVQPQAEPVDPEVARHRCAEYLRRTDPDALSRIEVEAWDRLYSRRRS